MVVLHFEFGLEPTFGILMSKRRPIFICFKIVLLCVILDNSIRTPTIYKQFSTTSNSRLWELTQVHAASEGDGRELAVYIGGYAVHYYIKFIKIFIILHCYAALSK
jgi:hypothetical protein